LTGFVYFLFTWLLVGSVSLRFMLSISVAGSGSETEKGI